MQKTAGAPGAPEPKKRDREVGHRRRLILSALLACIVLVGAVSLGALAQQPATTAESAAPPWLDEKQYAKVYLMFGVNELGYGDDAAFTAAFSRTVDEIRVRQPEAVLYIQSLVPIEPEKAHATNPASWLNNDNVARYNELLRQVCADKGVVYVDVAAALTDETGVLPPEGTTDGIHFTRSWYEKWYAYLKTHTVDPAEYAAGQPVAETEEMSE